MGNLTSKIFLNHGETDNKVKLQTHDESGTVEKHQCTPITTRRSLTIDPRSATIGIGRSPIVVDSTPTGTPKRTASAIPKYLQPKPYLETDIDSVIPSLTREHQIPDPRSPNITCQRTPIIVKNVLTHACSPVKVEELTGKDSKEVSMNHLDPRSPAINFDRTPIMKPKSPKNHDKVCNHTGKIVAKSTNLPVKYCETTTDYNIPEIQALPEIVSDKPLSFKERLEVCDDTCDEDNLLIKNQTDSSPEESDSEDQITVILNTKALFNQTQLSTKPENSDFKDKKLENDLPNEINDNVTNIVPESTLNSHESQSNNSKINIWRDISPIDILGPKTETYKPSEEIIIEFDDDQLVTNPNRKCNTVTEVIDENTTSSDVSSGNQKKDLQPMKEVKFMHEDSKQYNGIVNIDKQRIRAPLANRSNNHKMSLSNKSPQLLRAKNFSTKSIQQENTPPRTKRGKSKNKLHNTQWDLDRTIVI